MAEEDERQAVYGPEFQEISAVQKRLTAFSTTGQ